MATAGDSPASDRRGQSRIHIYTCIHTYICVCIYIYIYRIGLIVIMLHGRATRRGAASTLGGPSGGSWREGGRWGPGGRIQAIASTRHNSPAYKPRSLFVCAGAWRCGSSGGRGALCILHEASCRAMIY
jgi:hypothetical protein